MILILTRFSSAKHLILRLAIAWLVLLCMFTGAMVAVHLIPTSAIKHNTTISVEQLYDISQLPDTTIFPSLLRYDKFTDRIILDMVRNANTSRPVEAAMMNYVPSNDFQFDDSKKIFGEGSSEDYARYWQGHQIPTRIAMIFTTLTPLIAFNTVVGIILFLTVTFTIAYKQSRKNALVFAAFIMLSGFPLTMWSLQLTDIYFITFITMLYVLYAPKVTATTTNLSLTFFTVGAVTTFFDFLTFPLFTLCFPLATLQLMPHSSGRGEAITATLSWGLGYGALWGSKWIVGSILTGTNLFIKAFDGISERTGELSPDARPIIAVLILTAFILILTLLIGRRKHYRRSSLLFTAAIPIVWFIVLKNHSTVHFTFTWRTLLLTYYCISSYFLDNYVPKRKISDPDTML